MRWVLTGRELNFPKILSGEHRGINKGVQRDGREIDHVTILFGAGQSSAIFPPGRKLQAGNESDVAYVETLGVHQYLIPAQDIQSVCRRGSCGKPYGWGCEQKIKVRSQFADARRDVQMDRKHFHQVATPRN